MICMDLFVYFTETKSLVCGKLQDILTITSILICSIILSKYDYVDKVNTLKLMLACPKEKKEKIVCYFKVKYQLYREYFNNLKEMCLIQKNLWPSRLHSLLIKNNRHIQNGLMMHKTNTRLIFQRFALQDTVCMKKLLR